MPELPLKVAILGGGLAGAAVFRGLRKHEHLEVEIFESAPVFREQGAGMLFNNTAIWALELLGLRQALSDAGAVEMNSTRLKIGQGEDQGRTLFDISQRQRGNWNTQRSAFLEQIYKDVEPARMHTGKKLSSLETGEMITLHFEDMTTYKCDVLLGADGIHSKTRQFVVPEGHVAARPTFAGWWLTFKLMPFDAAVKQLGNELIDYEEPRQYAWLGQDGFAMHDVMSDKTIVQCVVAQRVPEEGGLDASNWKKTVTSEELRSVFRGWEPRVEQGIMNLMTDADTPKESDPQSTIDMISLWHHRPTPSLVNGRIALVGDAAGSTTPWQASGACMAMQDAFLLSELFAHVKTGEDATAALMAYDHVNRPNRERIIASSHEVGLLMSGCFPGVGMESEKLTESLRDRWDWIYDLDLMKGRDAAVEFMRKAIVHAGSDVKDDHETPHKLSQTRQ